MFSPNCFITLNGITFAEDPTFIIQLCRTKSLIDRLTKKGLIIPSSLSWTILCSNIGTYSSSRESWACSIDNSSKSTIFLWSKSIGLSCSWYYSVNPISFTSSLLFSNSTSIESTSYCEFSTSFLLFEFLLWLLF